jgi:hypothetical protein
MPPTKKTTTPAKTATTTATLPEMTINDRVVTIDVPMSLANSKPKMDKVMANVLKHLGCGGCHSGFDLRFRHIRDLVVDAKTLAVKTRGEIVR